MRPATQPHTQNAIPDLAGAVSTTIDAAAFVQAHRRLTLAVRSSRHFPAIKTMAFATMQTGRAVQSAASSDLEPFGFGPFKRHDGILSP